MTTEPEISPDSAPAQKSDKWSFMEFIKFVAIAAIIVLPIRFFVAEPFMVRGDSMDPTFKNNDYLIVEKINRRFNQLNRGDVVIFTSPVEKSRDLIKRVIGLPGEKLKITDSTVTITKKDGAKLDLKEPYIAFQSISPKTDITLSDTEYFVMGDNRPASYDSRAWGPLDKKYIIGRPILRLFSFSALGWWPGDYTFD